MNKIIKSIPYLFSLIIIMSLWNCGVKLPIPTPGIPSFLGGDKKDIEGAKVDFFPTIDETRTYTASLIQITENRVDAVFVAGGDTTISGDEEKTLNKILEKETEIYENFLSSLNRFITYVPEDGEMDINLKKGRENFIGKYATYNQSILAGLADFHVNSLERTAIESNARNLVTELEFIEASLPLPLDSLKVGSTFIIEIDSVDLFFQVLDDINDLTKKINVLRKTITNYQETQSEFQNFLERERTLTSDLTKSREEIIELYSAFDTTSKAQKEAIESLEQKLLSATDSLTSIINEINAGFKLDMSGLASQIVDSITSQRGEAEKQFFEVGTNMELFRLQIDSLKDVVRFYDIAENGLPELDLEVLDILTLPSVRHRIVLENGTIVVGQILAENPDRIIMQTSVGKLVIEKDFISEYKEKIYPKPKVVFEGEYTLVEHDKYDEIIGKVKNIGKQRADFVQIYFYLWDARTLPMGIGSSFASGRTVKFSTGVISTASIDPGNVADYKVIVEKGGTQTQVAYRTHEIKWLKYE